MKTKLALLVVPALSAVSSVPAFAQAAPAGIDYTPLTNNIDVTSTVAAILSVGAVMVGVSLAVMGVRKIISMARGG